MFFCHVIFLQYITTLTKQIERVNSDKVSNVPSSKMHNLHKKERLAPPLWSCLSIFIPGRLAAPQVPLSLIDFQDLLHLSIQTLIHLRQTLRQILMYRVYILC